MPISNQKLNYWGLLIYFAFATLSEAVSYGNLVMIVGLIMMIVATFMQGNGKIEITRSPILFYVLIFTVYCYLSKFWAENPSLTRNKTNAMIFVLIAMVVIFYSWNEENFIDDLLKVIMYGGYIISLYVMGQYGTSIISVITNQARAGSVLNSNTVGMSAAYALLINVYYVIYRGKFKALDLLIIPGVIMILASGSRKAFLIAVAGLFGIYILKNMKRENFGRSLIKILLIIVVLSLLLFGLMQLPFMAGIANRLESMFTVLSGEGSRSTDGWIRVQYIKLGMQLFKENPILGIGLGNANTYTMAYYGHDHYLHNNYVEILATLGAVGFVLYYSIYAYFLAVFWKYRRYRDQIYDITVIVMLLRLVMDYGNVTFYGKGTYVFLMLFWLEARRLKNSAYQINDGLDGGMII